MCLQCEPENDHGCCVQQMTLALHYASAIPRVYVRRERGRHPGFKIATKATFDDQGKSAREGRNPVL
jgi:hypothetical protein